MKKVIRKFFPISLVIVTLVVSMLGFVSLASDGENTVDENQKEEQENNVSEIESLENIIHGGVRVEIWDNETWEHRSQGGATFAGAELDIISWNENPVIVAGIEYHTNEVITTIFTDENGIAETSNYFLPKGQYVINTKTPPPGYIRSGQPARLFSIVEDGVIVQLNTLKTAIINDVKRGDLEGLKVDSNSNPLSGIPFRITSLSTGENHVIVTDDSGRFSTSSIFAPRGEFTNRGELWSDGIWFGEIIPSNEVGALIYDSYLIEELPSEHKVILMDPIQIDISEHDQVIDIGTIVNKLKGEEVEIPVVPEEPEELEKPDEVEVPEEPTEIEEPGESEEPDETEEPGEPEEPEENLEPEEQEKPELPEIPSLPEELEPNEEKENEIKIWTSMSFTSIDGSEISGKSLDLTLVTLGDIITTIDRVYYSGVTIGETYLINGTKMDTASNSVFLNDGIHITGQVEFTPTTSEGYIDVPFEFTLSEKYLENPEGFKTTTFEKMYLKSNGELVAVHEDINSEEQTLSFTKSTREEDVQESVKDNPQNFTAPKTGDKINLFFSIVLLLASGLCLGYIIIKKVKTRF